MSELRDRYGNELDKYDFQGVATDVMQLADVPTAVVTTLRWALLIPALVGVITAAVFGDRMPGWVLVPFVIGAMLLSMIGALAIGVLFVARRRLEESTQATGRILDTVGLVHHDLVELQGASVTHSAIEDLAHGFINSGALETAATGSLPTPLRIIAKPVATGALWGPKKILERTTTSLINDMPWAVLNAKTDELAQTAGESVELLTEIDAGYASAQESIEETVAAVIAKTTRPLTWMVAVLMSPLIVYWLIGGALT